MAVVKEKYPVAFGGMYADAFREGCLKDFKGKHPTAVDLEMRFLWESNEGPNGANVYWIIGYTPEVAAAVSPAEATLSIDPLDPYFDPVAGVAPLNAICGAAPPPPSASAQPVDPGTLSDHELDFHLQLAEMVVTRMQKDMADHAVWLYRNQGLPLLDALVAAKATFQAQLDDADRAWTILNTEEGTRVRRANLSTPGAVVRVPSDKGYFGAEMTGQWYDEAKEIDPTVLQALARKAGEVADARMMHLMGGLGFRQPPDVPDPKPLHVGYDMKAGTDRLLKHGGIVTHLYQEGVLMGYVYEDGFLFYLSDPKPDRVVEERPWPRARL